MNSLKVKLYIRIKLMQGCFNNNTLNKVLENTYEDIKEAVLKYEEYQHDLINIGIIISKEKFIEKWGDKTEDIVYKEIFGDWKK